MFETEKYRGYEINYKLHNDQKGNEGLASVHITKNGKALPGKHGHVANLKEARSRIDGWVDDPGSET